MNQIVLESPGKFVARDAPIPSVRAGFALVRVGSVGVCGSDFHAFKGSHPIYTYPRVIGHEVSGVIVECSLNGKGLRIGDRCAIEPYITCGSCRACLKGKRNCCENIQLFGVHIDGGFQEYLVVPLALLHKSSRLSMDQLALVETLGIGFHAVERSRVQKTDTALVIGAGPIGMAVVQSAAASCSVIHVVEKNGVRREFLRRMGYTATATPEGRQADVVFDATGNAQAMKDSVALVAPGGVLVYVGLTKGPVCFDDSIFHRREMTLMASRNSFGLFPRIIQLMEEGKVDTSHWVTERLSLSEVPSQFSSLSTNPEIVKSVIEVGRME